jgi:hypothetical protein
MTVQAIRNTPAIYADVVEVTPAMASEWLAQDDPNRTIKWRNVDDIARDLVAGTFDLNGETIKIDRNGALIDGRHRCLAIERTGISARVLVVFGLAPEAIKTVDLGSARTIGDQLGMVGEKHAPQLGALARRLVAYYANGERLVATAAATHPEMRALIAGPHGDAMRAAVDVAVSMYRKVDARVSTIAQSYYLCSEIDPDLTRELFVTKFRDGENMTKGDPVLALRARLRQMADDKDALVEPRQLAYFHRAWNHTRDGVRVSMMRGPAEGWNWRNLEMPR